MATEYFEFACKHPDLDYLTAYQLWLYRESQVDPSVFRRNGQQSWSLRKDCPMGWVLDRLRAEEIEEPDEVLRCLTYICAKAREIDPVRFDL